VTVIIFDTYMQWSI